MGTIADIGVPGQPLKTPPLTAWQAAVRDMLNAQAASDAWTSWTPSITGATASVVDARYRRTRGGLLTVNASFTLTAVTGSFTFTLPVAASKQANGTGMLSDANGGTYWGLASVGAGTTVCYVYPMNAAGTYGAVALTSATVPFTWEAGDKIHVSLSCQCAPLP